MKIRDVLTDGIDKLNEFKVDDAFIKAKMLLMHELGYSNEYLTAHMQDELDKKILDKFDEEIESIIHGKPIQYITNCQSFYGLEFYVDEAVLIPQPDTEVIVEEVINIAKNKNLKILDMCTGSGAIAIAVSRNIYKEVVASDISERALEITKKNATVNNAMVRIIQSDMFENINEKFDIIVSNPPYIETDVIDTLSKEVKNEPRIALDGGEDGLDFYRILTKQAPNYLENDGILAVEIGFNQKDKVIKLFEENGFENIYSKIDFGGNDRIVVGKWRKE